jgi:hypothetical protein
MGINLCSVDSVDWEEMKDGQIKNLTINFIPAPPDQDSCNHEYERQGVQWDNWEECIHCGHKK